MNPLKRLVDAIRRSKRRTRRSGRPALNDLDAKLEKYLKFRDGYFIEAGANDGYSQSNTYYLEKVLGWRGVLIEGIPELYERCKVERDRSRVFNCALVSDGFAGSSVTMQYAHLMSVVDGSLKVPERQATHIQAGIKVQNLNGSYSVEVPARTLTSVLSSIPDLPHIDFFSLDVEGYELSVLQGLDLNRFRPTLILVEANFFEEVNAYLIANDYVMVDQVTFHDYLYRDAGKG